MNEGQTAGEVALPKATSLQEYKAESICQRGYLLSVALTQAQKALTSMDLFLVYKELICSIQE